MSDSDSAGSSSKSTKEVTTKGGQPESSETGSSQADQGSPASPSQAFSFEPTTASSWVRPGFAAIVVSIVALAILGIVGWTLIELAVVNGDDGATADPNAGTIAAIASAGLSALVSLASAYFGIKFASEQASQANATAAIAMEVASKASANSTSNGNPKPEDI
jgi:hypothetical protein